MSTQVQRDFINSAARPYMEVLIRILHELDTFIADYDALQGSADVLAVDSVTLNDDTATTARADAPILTGADIKAMRDLSSTMSATINGATKTILIGKMVRPLNTVLKLN